MRRVIVCGGRKFQDRQAVFRALDEEHRRAAISAVVEGGATGVDRWAGEWADDNDVEHFQANPEWHKYGKAAGPIRNAEMLRHYGEIAAVIAFPGGRGTADMLRQACEKGVRVIEPLGAARWKEETSQ